VQILPGHLHRHSCAGRALQNCVKYMCNALCHASAFPTAPKQALLRGRGQSTALASMPRKQRLGSRCSAPGTHTAACGPWPAAASKEYNRFFKLYTGAALPQSDAPLGASVGRLSEHREKHKTHKRPRPPSGSTRLVPAATTSSADDLASRRRAARCAHALIRTPAHVHVRSRPAAGSARSSRARPRASPRRQRLGIRGGQREREEVVRPLLPGPHIQRSARAGRSRRVQAARCNARIAVGLGRVLATPLSRLWASRRARRPARRRAAAAGAGGRAQARGAGARLGRRPLVHLDVQQQAHLVRRGLLRARWGREPRDARGLTYP